MTRPDDDEPTLTHPALDAAELEESQSRPRVHPVDVRLRVAPVRLGPLELDRVRALDAYAAQLEARAQALAGLEAEARERGWREGFEEAVRQNTQAFFERLETFEKNLTAFEKRLPTVVLDMAVRLASRCLGRELAASDDAMKQWVRAHAAALMPAVSVTCLHAAADAPRLPELQEALVREFPHTHFVWRMDPEVPLVVPEELSHGLEAGYLVQAAAWMLARLPALEAPEGW